MKLRRLRRGRPAGDLTGGEQVYLYGVGYSSCFIVSNGYVTLGSGATDFSESLTEHFDAPAAVAALYLAAALFVIGIAGVLTRRTWFIPTDKVQSVAVVRTVFQRRLGLGSLRIDSAATADGVITVSPAGDGTVNIGVGALSTMKGFKKLNLNTLLESYRRLVQEKLRLGILADESVGVKLRDIDGNWAYDLAGNKASATVELMASTTSAFTPPNGNIDNIYQKTTGDGRVYIRIVADDPDNDILTFKSDSEVVPITVDGEINVDFMQPGEYIVTFTVEDGSGLSDEQQVTITVLEND